MSYPFNIDTVPYNNKVLLKVHIVENAGKQGKMLKSCKSLENNQAVVGEVVKASNEILELLPAGTYVLFDRYATFGKPTIEQDQFVLVDIAAVIAIANLEGT